jgi:type IV pilus assembly protein PilM
VPDEPMWKKEVSFERKQEVDQTEPTAETTDNPEAEAPDADAASAESLWKQELTFRRKIEHEHEPGTEAEVEAEPVTAESESSEAATVEPLWKREVSAEEAKVEPVAEENPVQEIPVEETPVEEPVLVEAVAVEAVAEVELTTDPVVVPLPVDPEPSPVLTWSAIPAVSPALVDEAPTASLPVVEPERVAAADVHPPVEAEELAPVATENVPFWKKDLSFGGGKKKQKTVPAAENPAQSAEKVPFWKKDLSFGGGKKKAEGAPVAEAAVPVAEAVVPSSEKVPFWKKDLSFGGGKKAEKTPKAEKAPKPAKAPKGEKQPKERRAKEPKIKAERGSKGGGKRLVGLKIGASQLAAARVSNNGSAELQQVAREPLAPGIVVAGELRDPDALSAALKDFFDKHKLPKRGVRLGIANNRIGVRTFDIAGISDQKQLGNAIRFRAQEALPIPIDEAVLDYQVLGDGVDEEGQPTKRILLVVAYRELIDRYVDACKRAGITLSGIDLEAFALLRALQAPQEGVGSDPAAALVAVSIGHERSTFAVSDGRVCEFTRVLDWGGSALNVALARVLNAAPSEVESVKHELTLTDSTIPDGLNAEQATKCVEALRKAIQTFARELVSSLQYYQNQPGSLGIAEIVLTGGTAHLPGLAGELERLIGVRVRVGDPLARMKVSKKVGDPAQIGSFAVAIGLGIED